MIPEIPGVKGLVARLLIQDPDLTTRDIHGRAIERYPQLQDVSLREFNARYVLQVKRNMVGRKPRRTLPMPGENGTRPEPTPPSRKGPDDRQGGLDLLHRAAAEARHFFPGSRVAAPPSDAPAAPAAEAPSPAASDASTLPPAASPAVPDRRSGREDRTPPREALRLLFFKLALELELTRNDSELVDVIAGVERYVDEALAAVKG